MAHGLCAVCVQFVIMSTPPPHPHPLHARTHPVLCLIQSERERSEATSRLSAALQELSAGRAESTVRVNVLKGELSRATAAAAAIAASEAASAAAAEANQAAAAAAAAAEVVALRRALVGREGEVEGLRGAVDSERRRAEIAEGLAEELERSASRRVVTTAAREEGREEGRREAEQRWAVAEEGAMRVGEGGGGGEGGCS